MQEFENNATNLLSLKTAKGFDYINYSKIIMFKADRHNTLCYTIDCQTPLKVFSSLGSIEKANKIECIYRCNKSHIINMMHIVKLEVKSHELIMKNNLVIKLSKNSLKLFLKKSGSPLPLVNSQATQKMMTRNFRNIRDNHFKNNIINAREFKKYVNNIFGRLLLITLSIVIILLSIRCESKDRFYRPNLPEKLCSIGIIDADDKTNYDFTYLRQFDVRNSVRFISFEKSSQLEYPEEMRDSLREFSFKISTNNKEVYNYRKSQSIKMLQYIEIPDSIDFISGNKYSLLAQEKDFPDIFAEVIVPEAPPPLTLISVNKEIGELIPTGCYHPFDTAYNAVFKISFQKTNAQDQFYALLIDGRGAYYPESPPMMYSGPVDFKIKETNTQGFIAEMQGLKIIHHACFVDGIGTKASNAYAYFFEYSKIFGNEYNISVSVPYHDNYSTLAWLNWVRIKLLSIPKEMYFFEKSLYTYGKTTTDPFTEPVYLNGNIKGGNGLFAICRSTSLKQELGWNIVDGLNPTISTK